MRGANILLAFAPAYVLSLPKFLQAVAKQKEDGTPFFRMLLLLRILLLQEKGMLV